MVEWNERTFDINLYPYAEEAYRAGKFAFVADVARLFILANYGGIYMDTDVELLKSLDDLLDANGFTGFESDRCIPTAIMAAEKGNGWVEDQLSIYAGLHFIKPDGSLNCQTNVSYVTQMSMERHGLVPNGQFQVLTYGMRVYPVEFFCPKDFSTGRIHVTANSYSIHHFRGSWLTPAERARQKAIAFARLSFGEQNFYRIRKSYHRIKENLSRIS